MEKNGQGTHSTKMSAYKLAENNPNAPNLSDQIVCPSPRVWDFNEKSLHWASVVRGRKTCGVEQLTIAVSKLSLRRFCAVFAHIKIGFLTTSGYLFAVLEWLFIVRNFS